MGLGTRTTLNHSAHTASLFSNTYVFLGKNGLTC